jgi:hypothetical protein
MKGKDKSRRILEGKWINPRLLAANAMFVANRVIKQWIVLKEGIHSIPDLLVQSPASIVESLDMMKAIVGSNFQI